jgi:uncharacterized phage protein (TIGR01671 family)
MDRVIKFRAWNGKKMVLQFDGIANIDSFNTSVEKQLLVCIGGYSWGTANWGKDCILMQFTGLHDKNGKEVFEGDVCKVQLPMGGFWGDVKTEKTGVIEFNEDICAFIVRWEWSKNQHHIQINCDLDLEVIGNRFENPELCE